jgi:hypothetical protein
MPKPRSNIMHRPILYAIMWIEGYCQHIRIQPFTSTQNVGILQFALFWLTTSPIQGLFLLDLLHIVLDSYQNRIPWVDCCQIHFNSLPSPYKEPHNNSCVRNSKIQIHISPWIMGPKRCPRCQQKAHFKSIKLMERYERESRVNTHFVTDEWTVTWQQIERQSSKQHKSIKRLFPETAEVPIKTSFYSVHDNVGVVWENRLAVSQ